ncbi:hypothetical protein Dd1591_0728 [Dickeya chrysanthemi Ech1591]|uniref:Uncharacterized protein n=1 Tax=Dickeya chrysanthemi (strain Ech1591) TaxID=561229 RepID=C6CKV8_DICC1|nr:hypothetical protein Dd1591_0728 [Dickeya chrysanthemi Ech1591]
MSHDNLSHDNQPHDNLPPANRLTGGRHVPL